MPVGVGPLLGSLGMMARKIRVIINPRAGNGKAEQKIGAIDGALRDRGLLYDLVTTGAPGDATRLAREAVRDGVDVIGVVGGDGTINEVSQAFIDGGGELISHRPELALIPAGTGGDFRKSFGLSNDVDDAIRRIVEPRRAPLDLGVLELAEHDGAPTLRAFLNVASFGISGLTDRLVNETPKWMGGTLAFFLGTLRASFIYKNAPVRLLVDGRPLVEGRIFLVALANGRYFGGGMKVAPQADPSDGELDVVVLGDLSRIEVFGLSTKIYRGAHLSLLKAHVARGARIEAEALDGGHVFLDVDGETPGRLPISAKVFPGALRILT